MFAESSFDIFLPWQQLFKSKLRNQGSFKAVASEPGDVTVSQQGETPTGSRQVEAGAVHGAERHHPAPMAVGAPAGKRTHVMRDASLENRPRPPPPLPPPRGDADQERKIFN